MILRSFRQPRSAVLRTTMHKDKMAWTCRI
jgi:hypothetical protein